MSARIFPPLVQVTSSRSWGGRERVPLVVHRELVQRGVAARLVCDHASGIARHGGSVSGLMTAGLEPRLSLGGAAVVRRTVRACDARAVLVHRTRDLALVRWALRGMSAVGVIVVKHVGPGAPKKDVIHRLLYRRVERVLAVSEYIRAKCEATYPIAGERCKVWYLGVDVDQLAYEAANALACRRRLGLSPATQVVGTVARVTPGKGWETLLEAFAEVVRRKPDVRLLAVGGASVDEAWFEAQLQRRCLELGIDDSVIWVGQVEDIRPHLWAMDIFVTPSAKEAFGLNTVEAMAAGRPVIGIAAAGTAEIVTPGVDGLLASPPGASELAHEITDLIDSKELRVALGRAARATAEQRFSIGSMMERLLGLL